MTTTINMTTTTNKITKMTRMTKMTKMTKTPKILTEQEQLFFVVGNLDQPVDGSTSFCFMEFADPGDGLRADRQAVARAATYGLKFTPVLRVYARCPRIIGGRASAGRII